MQLRVICQNPPQIEAHDQFGILDRLHQIYSGRPYGTDLIYKLEARISRGRNHQPSLGAIWLHGRPSARQLVLALRRQSTRPKQLEHRLCFELMPDWSLVQQALRGEGVLTLLVDLQPASQGLARINWELHSEPIFAAKVA
jgi:hypothetical protein